MPHCPRAKKYTMVTATWIQTAAQKECQQCVCMHACVSDKLSQDLSSGFTFRLLHSQIMYKQQHQMRLVSAL